MDRSTAEFEAESAYASALFCQMRGDGDGCVHMLQRSLEWLPTYAPAMQAFGIAQYQLGQRAEGRRLLMGLLDLNEDTAHLFKIIDQAGDFLIEKRRYLDGLELYRGAAARFPSVAVFFQGISCCADHLKRFEEAIAACREALSLDPINAKLVSDLGWCLFRAGRIAEALVELERAVEMDPADELARGNLNLVRKEITRGSRARKKPRADSLWPADGSDARSPSQP